MSRAHHVVSATIGFARDHGELRDRRLAIGVQELRAVLDDAAVLLRDTRKKSRDVFESDERDVECIAKPDEARTFE